MRLPTTGTAIENGRMALICDAEAASVAVAGVRFEFAFATTGRKKMAPRSESRDFEEAYRRFEFAPLVTAALIVASWMKARRTAQPAAARGADSEDAFGGARSPGKP